jgi:carbamoyl-phosphate synthase small subunit
MKAKLVLENGAVFDGEAFGDTSGETSGEVVFNTSMTGYQEILTDPSYAGQIVTMTYPLIGNYGINEADMESVKPQVAGFVVREYFEVYSNFRASSDLGSWLKKHGIMGIQGIDTRMLTRIIRTTGAMRGIISTGESDTATLIKRVKQTPEMSGSDLASVVSTPTTYTWSEVDTTPFALDANARLKEDGSRWNVVVYDFGVKHNILRRLTSYGCDLTVVPASFSAEDVLAMRLSERSRYLAFALAISSSHLLSAGKPSNSNSATGERITRSKTFSRMRSR